jgi:putative redox protein
LSISAQCSLKFAQPLVNGGFDEGMTPPELLLASLGSCGAYYVAEFLAKNKLASEGTRVRVNAQKRRNPARLDDFRIEVESPVELTETQRAGMEEAVHDCLVHNTLLNPPTITLSILAPARSRA